MRGDPHYTLTHPEGAAEIFGSPSCNLEPRYNIAPGQQAPVAVLRENGSACVQMRWGLLPRWRGHGGKRGALVHAAPLEAVQGTPLLRDAFKKQRCLVIADGCFAWRELKQPIWFHPEPPRPIAFAGVYATSDDDGVPSFAILLGPPLATRVHDPMPIVVPESSYASWLDPSTKTDSATELLIQVPLLGWRADAVSTRMSSDSNDDPKCIEPVGNPNQGDLF
jgi:putative SOS response-associated peptidase YedK